MKKKVVILSIVILAIVGVFSFINIFNVDKSFIKASKYASGIEDIVDLRLRDCINDEFTKLNNNPPIGGADTNGDGTIDIDDIKELSCPGYGITTLDGLDSMSNLTGLFLPDNKLSGSINVSLPNLQVISINRNKGVTALNVNSLALNELHIANTGIKEIKNVSVNETSVANRTEKLLAGLTHLNVAGVTWDSDLSDIVYDNKDTLKVLNLSGVGLNGYSFFEGKESLFPALEDLNLGNHDFGTLNVSAFPVLKTFNCSNCNLTSITVNENLLEKLYLSNNKITNFHATEEDHYKKLQELDLSGNPLEMAFCEFKTAPDDALTLSHVNIGSFDPENYSKTLKTLTMRNAGLSGNIDLHKFTNLKEIYFDNVNNHTYPNKVGTIALDHTGGGTINVLDVSNNASSVNISTTKREEEGDAEAPVINISDLRMNFVNSSGLNFTNSKIQGLQKLSFVGSKFKKASMQGYDELKSGLVSLNAGLIPISDFTVADYPTSATSGNLNTLGVTYTYPKSMNLNNYNSGTRFVVVSQDDTVMVTSNDTLPVSDLLTLVPVEISNVNNYSVFDGFTDVDYKKIGEIKVDGRESRQFHLHSDGVSMMKNNSPITNPLTYDGYYNVTMVKVSSTDNKYKFDENLGVVIVGDEDEKNILNNIVLSSNTVSKKKDENGNIVIYKGDKVYKTYKISHEDPSSYQPSGNAEQNNGEGDLPSGGQHNSNDPLDGQNPPPGGGNQQPQPNPNYNTVQPTNTGAFISVVSLVVLIIAGVFSKIYLKKKRRSEELIEKI